MAVPTNSQRARTVQEASTSLPPADVLREAKVFFGRQNGVYSAFLEQEGPSHITLRGQGGEEIVIAAATSNGETRVTASSYLFDQQIARFLSTLPPPHFTGSVTGTAQAVFVPSPSQPSPSQP